MGCRLSLLLALCAPACAQLRLFVLSGDEERAVGDALQLERIPVGDSLDTRFRVRNAGSAPALLDSLSVSGVAFALRDAPALPVNLAPQGSADFTVRFSPSAFGTYSAALAVNRSTVLLAAATLAVVSVLVDQHGSFAPLRTGEIVDFGAVEQGAAAARRFRLLNQTPAALTVDNIITTAGFSHDAAARLRLQPNEAYTFQVTFRAGQEGTVSGELLVDERRFRLRATTTLPPFPALTLEVEPDTLQSGQQARARVRMSPSRRGGTGELRLTFQPAMEGAVDPSIRFATGAGGSVPFQVRVGDTLAQFAAEAEIGFQTGTTAGILTLSARLGEQSATRVFPIAIAPVVMRQIRTARTAGGLEVTLTGFDNARSAGALTFSFFDSGGALLGIQRADVADAFRRFFAGSDAGGAFQLRAVFPVTGDASRVAAVDVEATNSAGAARSQRTPF